MCADETEQTDWANGPKSHPFFGGWFDRPRIQRGDMSPIILRVLAKVPMHGYQIIRTLEEKSHGFWRPSAGSVYPTLQMLAEQGLVTSKDIDGKTVYSLTKDGEASAKAAEDKHPWKEHRRLRGQFHAFAPAIRELFMALKVISQSESDSAVSDARAILDEAKVKLTELAKKSTEH